MNYKEIIKIIDDNYLSDAVEKQLLDQYESQDYKDWNDITKGQKLLGDTLLCDTTGLNFAFTYFQQLIEEHDAMKFIDHFYVQKSYLGNFVTFYVKSQSTRRSEGEIMNYNTNILCKPFGKFKQYFDASWEYLNRFYPNLVYIPFELLEMTPSKSGEYKIKKKNNIYELLFGYEGNILKHKVVGNKNYKM